MLAIHALTSVVMSQGSLSRCCHTGRFRRRTDKRSTLVRIGNDTALIGLVSSISAVPPEDERGAGNSRGTPLVIVEAGDGMVATDSGSSFTIVLPEGK